MIENLHETNFIEELILTCTFKFVFLCLVILPAHLILRTFRVTTVQMP